MTLFCFAAQKLKFSLKISSETADLVTFLEEILDEKLHFLCSVCVFEKHQY